MLDEKLLIIIRKNPNKGLQKLLDLYGGSVSTVCRNFLYDCSELDVEEAISDTFINFWKHVDKFELNQNYSLKSYLYAIARNVARDKRRTLKKADIFSLPTTFDKGVILCFDCVTVPGFGTRIFTGCTT